VRSGAHERAGTSGRGQGVRLFDFRKPNKLGRDEARNLQIGLESFARSLATAFSISLRAASSVTVGAIDQLSYDDYVRDMATPTHMTVLSLAPLPGLAILDLPVDMVLTTVDLLLGGSGRGYTTERPLTDIEVSLMRSLLERALPDLVHVVGGGDDLVPAIVGHESNPQFVQLAAPTDMMVVFRLTLQVDEMEAEGSLGLPFSTLEPVLDRFRGRAAAELPAGGLERSRAQLSSRLEEVPVQVQVVFPPVTVSSADIVDLQVGDVVPLGQPIDEPMWGVVEGERVMRVRPGRRNKRLAAQVLEISSRGER
jgi:flagellar motor switch protein FliM